MKQKEVKNSIRQAFSHATPDVLSSVLSDCAAQKGTVIVMTEKKKLHWGVKLAAMAAVLALILGIGFGAGNYRLNHTVSSTISLDVNPSIEIRVNRHERVLEALALNEGAKTVLDGMDLKGSDLNVAVNAVIGSMVHNGFITDVANAILISVDSKDAAEGKALQEKLTLEVSKLLDTQTFDGAVLSQTVRHETELEIKAQEFGITVGKAQLIDRIVENDSTHTFDELVDLSVHQLNLILDGKKTDVQISGVPSEKGYCGRDTAKGAALTHAGLNAQQVEQARVQLDFEDGLMVYEVEFVCDGWEYEYEIHAVDGTVLNYEKEYTGEEQLEIQPPDGKIGEKLAVETALQHAGLTMDLVEKLTCELDEDDEVRHYEVSFRSGVWKYEYEIAAYMPMVLDWEKEQVYDVTPVEPPEVDK